MPKKNTELRNQIEQEITAKNEVRFKNAGTYLRYIILKILSDGLPRTKKEIIKDYEKIDIRVSKPSIIQAIEGLYKKGVVVESEELYRLPEGPELSLDEMKIIKILKKQKRLPGTLQALSEIPEDAFEEATSYLETVNLIEYVKEDYQLASGESKIVTFVKLK